MSDEKTCQTFLRAAAVLVRRVGLARGKRKDYATGAVCMLGAMDFCGIYVSPRERDRIEKHICGLLPIPNRHDVDTHNGWIKPGNYSRTIAWWSNMKAETAEDVAEKLELAAESC